MIMLGGQREACPLLWGPASSTSLTLGSTGDACPFTLWANGKNIPYIGDRAKLIKNKDNKEGTY